MESTDIFCLLKVNKVDEGDFIAETWAIQPPRKVNKKKRKKKKRDLVQFGTPALPLRLMVDPWRKRKGGLGRTQVVVNYLRVAEQPPEPFKSLGSSLVWRPIPRLPTCVLSVTDRALMQRPTLEFVSPCVAHMKERSPTAPPSNKLINYAWWVWGLKNSWAGWTGGRAHIFSSLEYSLPTQKAIVNTAKVCVAVL